MTATVVSYETNFSQAFYNKGVRLGPEEHAAGRMDALRHAYVNTALLDPKVGAAQFGLVTGNGVGSEWTIKFTEKNYKIVVQFDISRKDKWSHVSTRNIGYILSVTVVQTNIPNAGATEPPPRQLMITLT